MDFLENIEWYITSKPNTATNKTTSFSSLTQEEFDRVIFDDSSNENIKLCFPLHNNGYSFSLTREIPRPVTLKKLFTFIYKFYQEPLGLEHIEKAFEGNEEIQDEIIDKYDGDITKIKKYDVFDSCPAPDFCGLSFDEETSEYIVGIGPE
jgi:hypothetical protein